jgi:hypothetical protein
MVLTVRKVHLHQSSKIKSHLFLIFNITVYPSMDPDPGSQLITDPAESGTLMLDITINIDFSTFGGEHGPNIYKDTKP